MKRSTDIGMNRSGMATAPMVGPEMMEVPVMTVPTLAGDSLMLGRERAAMARMMEPAVTMPPPGTVKELAKTTVKFIKGEKATVFIDKLGERLAFERAGVRLYEALVSKLNAYGTFDGGPTHAQLEHILLEEKEHFILLQQAMISLGSDATAVTPSANLHDVMSSGLRMVLADPRTDLRQCLEAALVAELADNDCWMNLAELAEQSGEKVLAARFRECLRHEEEHLTMVRNWIQAGLSLDAFGDETEIKTPGGAKKATPRPLRKPASTRARAKRPASSRGRRT